MGMNVRRYASYICGAASALAIVATGAYGVARAEPGTASPAPSLACGTPRVLRGPAPALAIPTPSEPGQLRDGRPSRMNQRSKALLVTVISQLEALLSTVRDDAPD